MIYRDELKRIGGVTNQSDHFTAERHVQIFADNLAELEQWLQDTPKKWSYNASQDSHHPASKSWDLDAGFSGALKMAKEGWHEGAENLDARLHAIIPAAGRESRWGYAESGSSVNIGRYLTGHPKNMRSRRKKQMGSAPVLHIVINGNASCAINGEQMANYGTALVGLIDRLENTGKRVQLDVLYALREGKARVAAGWNVKRASEHIDLSAVAFSIAHPAAFRRLGFAMLERTKREYQQPGYGYCADLVLEDLTDGSEATMLIDGVNHNPGRCNSPKDALRYAIEQLNKAAVIAGHATPDAPLIPDDEELFAY